LKRRPRRAGRVHAIVPLNILRKSKARLSPMLKPAEREQLTVAMLKDVLLVLKRSRQVGSVTVVSADKNARSISRRFGANFLWEGKRRGLNKGLKLAISNSERRGASSVLVIHSDLPLLKPREIDEFLEKSQAYSVSLTPSKDGAGTNALLMRPPRVIRPVFGRDSFRKHLSLAMKTNARSRVIRLRGISFDVDKPRDLVNLMRRPLRNETGRFLQTLRKRS
jgi:2-phospho-L-lactate guanylyltransferase